MLQGGADEEYDYGEETEFERSLRKRIRVRRIVLLTILAVLILGIIAVFLLRKYYKYSSCELSWEKQMSEGSLVDYERFGENVLKYSHDGASYFDLNGREIWVDSFEMKNPKAAVSGDYAIVADVGGNMINIYHLSGRIGSADTVLPVTKATVSENGVVAAITEDSAASYITFYRKTGDALDITIKSRLEGEGYPTDIALSPDGTQLISAFVYVDGGKMKSKVVFYDFSEIGKNVANRLIAGFEESFENSMIGRVRFINSTYSYAAADTGIYFFSSKNLASPEQVKDVVLEETIETIFNCRNRVGVVTRNEDSEEAYRLTVYKADGSEEMTKDFSNLFRYATSDGEYIYFTDDDSCLILNMEGNVKFDGQMSDCARIITKKSLPGTFVFTSPGFMREYQFR